MVTELELVDFYAIVEMVQVLLKEISTGIFTPTPIIPQDYLTLMTQAGKGL
jgi:hypothetical protein